MNDASPTPVPAAPIFDRSAVDPREWVADLDLINDRHARLALVRGLVVKAARTLVEATALGRAPTESAFNELGALLKCEEEEAAQLRALMF